MYRGVPSKANFGPNAPDYAAGAYGFDSVEARTPSVTELAAEIPDSRILNLLRSIVAK